MRPARWIAAVAVTFALLATAQVARADFAAIAYSPATGSFGFWHGAGSRADAENGALDSCNGEDRRVVVWVENGWAALATNNDGGWGYGWSTNSREEAENNALDGAGPGSRILCWVASGS